MLHGITQCYLPPGRDAGFVSSRNAPERRSGPFRHIAAKFSFHLNESDKFALFGSKMPSASGGASPRWPPWTPLGAPPPDPHIGSRSRARHILSVPVLFLTGNEPCRDDIPALTPAEAGTRFSDPGGMQGWVDLVGWLHTEMVYPPEDGHPSQY